MLRFVDGFDHYNTRAQMLRKWDAVANANTISTSYGRFGTQGVYLQEGGYSILGQGSIAKNIGHLNSDWGFFGGAFNFVSLPSTGQFVLFAIYDIGFGSAMHCCVAVLADGSVALGSVIINNLSSSFNVFASSDPGVITASATRYIEVAFNVDAGAIVHLDGEEIINFSEGIHEPEPGSGNGITESANSWFSHVKVGGGANGGNATVYLDDFYYCDDTGTTNNDFLGDVRVYTLWPEDVGASSDFTRNGGTVDGNYTAVDELAPDDDTSFVDTDVPGSEDFYEMEDLSGQDIFAVAVTSCARAADDSAGSIQNQILSNSVTGSAPTRALSSTYTFVQDIFETNPDTLDQWTAAEVNDAQAGIKFVG